jgi:3-deoxy-D-manno-octulosonic-acid transferase
VQSYMPYDLGFMAARFLRYFKPRLCLLMETEVWPNMVAQCVRHGVPVALVNARLSEKSLRRGQRFAGLMQEAASGLALVAAQTDADAGRLKRFGAQNVHTTGSFKFDVAPPAEVVARGALWRSRIGARPVLLCASTRDGEEALILSALEKVDRTTWGETLLVLVPRHPQRFDKVAALIDAMPGLTMQRRSAMQDGTAVLSSTRVLLGDTMGEMFAYYAACDLAFIGGSLLPLGGQNLIEAAALGKPVLIGPHTFNFAQSTKDAVEIGCALQIPDADAMLATAAGLLRDLVQRQAMQRAALLFAGRFQGATERVLPLLAPLIQNENVD